MLKLAIRARRVRVVFRVRLGGNFVEVGDILRMLCAYVEGVARIRYCDGAVPFVLLGKLAVVLVADFLAVGVFAGKNEVVEGGLRGAGIDDKTVAVRIRLVGIFKVLTLSAPSICALSLPSVKLRPMLCALSAAKLS